MITHDKAPTGITFYKVLRDGGRRLQRRKWSAGEHQGKTFEFELRVTEAEIDAEEARAGKERAA